MVGSGIGWYWLRIGNAIVVGAVFLGRLFNGVGLGFGMCCGWEGTGGKGMGELG